MDEKRYDEALAWCQKMISSNHLMLYRLHEFHQSLLEASTRFALPRECLESFFRHIHLRHFKKIHYQISNLTPSIVKLYSESHNLSIVQIAINFRIPPSVAARVIIENVTEFKTPTNQTKKIEKKSPITSTVHDVSVPITRTSLDVPIQSVGNDNEEEVFPENQTDMETEATQNGTVGVTDTKTRNSDGNVQHNSGTSSSNITPSTIPHKKSPSEKKAIRNALHDPLTILSDSSVIRPSYRPSLCTVLDSSYMVDKVDLFTGLPPTTLSTSAPSPNKLAYDVWDALEQDPMYGPRHDRLGNFIGLEYELALEDHLHSMNLPFETERDLRERGASKTPDILFKIPLAIKVPRRRQRVKDENSQQTLPSTQLQTDRSDPSGSVPDVGETNELEWKIVQWVDSKAYFGDEYTHRNIVLPQAESYVNRFGPGLILYWFGHAPLTRLDDGGGDICITAWAFPNSCLLPADINVEVGYPFIDSM